MTDPSSLTDQQLSELFAVEVAGIWRHETPRASGVRAYSVVQTGAWREIHPDQWAPDDLPDFATSVDAVLPWLEKHGTVVVAWAAGSWSVAIHTEIGEGETFDMPVIGEWDDPVLARAACIALIRAKRANRTTP